MAQKYAKFRREVSVLRKEFIDDWTEEQKTIQFSNEAAENIRLKEAEEARAFEIASRELERMAKEREAAEEKEQEILRIKREKGDAVRQLREEEMLERLTEKTEAVENARSDVITDDNIEEKIRVALEQEVCEDYVLVPDNGEMKSITYKNIE